MRNRAMKTPPATRSTRMLLARPPDESVESRPLSAYAYEVIFSAIQTGRLAPGSRVREAELRQSLGMSRTPLREALQRLESERLLSFEPLRGIRISRLDEQGINELYVAREWAEAAAAALAARNADDAEIATMRHILDLEQQATEDPIRGARFNRKLHETIHGATRNRYLTVQLKSLAALLALVGDCTRRSPTRVVEAHREHEAIVAAIEARDPLLAERCARRHIAAARRSVLANWTSTTLA
jgi:DNA-binding GntR family transcriptional regulator